MSEGSHNRRTAWRLSLIVLGMFGFGFAMVPLYGLVCQATGIQSATPVFAAAEVEESDGGRMVTVKFDATVNDKLPWEFSPNVRSVRVAVGKMHRVSYSAHNRSARPITGQAIPSVVPWQATRHFSKTECFCFTQQTLKPGETKEMPLAFLVSPELPENIHSLTLSYSFMRVEGEPAAPAPITPLASGGSRP